MRLEQRVPQHAEVAEATGHQAVDGPHVEDGLGVVVARPVERGALAAQLVERADGTGLANGAKNAGEELGVRHDTSIRR